MKVQKIATLESKFAYNDKVAITGIASSEEKAFFDSCCCTVVKIVFVDESFIGRTFKYLCENKDGERNYFFENKLALKYSANGEHEVASVSIDVESKFEVGDLVLANVGKISANFKEAKIIKVIDYDNNMKTFFKYLVEYNGDLRKIVYEDNIII